MSQLAKRAVENGPHRSRPSEDWVSAFLDHVRSTGQPETFEAVDWSIPPSTSEPVILKPFDVDRRKRPKRDMAPCALCSPCHPKCLNGLYLVWYPDEGLVRVVGPQCGRNLEAGRRLVEARIEYDRERKKLRLENFLEANLPNVDRMVEALRAFRPAAAEAARLHAKLKHDCSAIPKRLRIIWNQSGRELVSLR